MSMTETEERKAEGAEDGGDAQRSEPTQRVATLHASPAEGPVEIRVFGATDVGLVREHNEDNYTFADLGSGTTARNVEGVFTTTLGGRGFFAAVCDGMGGAAAGEVASQMGVDTLLEMLGAGEPPEERDEFARRLVDAIQEAGTRIFSAAKMDRTRRGMGTTSTVAGLIDKVLFVGQVGDSRAYVLRDGELGLITKDQSLVNQLIEAGQLSEEEAENFEHSNIILQALGTTERVVVDLTFLELRRGDRLMLCSDGLSGLVHSSAIGEVLGSVKGPAEAAKRLIEMANTAGGHDNVTCVIVDFDGEGLPPAISGAKPSYQPYPLPADESGAESNGARREPTVKTSTQKPGADVKRGGRDRENTPPPFAALTGSKNPLVAFVAALVVVLVAALAFGVFSDGEKKPVRRSEATSVARAPVDVHVTSDVVGGELYIDGKHAGELSPDQITVLELQPGAYRFDARVEGTTVVSSVVTVRSGRTEEKVDLSMPSGVGREDDALEDEDYEDDELDEPSPPPPSPATPVEERPSGAQEPTAAEPKAEPKAASPAEKVEAPREPTGAKKDETSPPPSAGRADDPMDVTEELDRLPSE
jgi:serine/threonine protein phosphatase PrpC